MKIFRISKINLGIYQHPESQDCVILSKKLYDRNTGSIVIGANKVLSDINVNVVFQQYSKNTFFYNIWKSAVTTEV